MPAERSRLFPCLRSPFTFTVVQKDDTTRSIVARCGHPLWEFDLLQIGDLAIDISSAKPRFSAWAWRLRAVWQPKQCLNCENVAPLKATILCPMCGVPIFAGEPVATYGLTGGDPDTPYMQFATRVEHNPSVLVCCMGRNCCPSSNFFAGIWSGEGIISPYATGTALGDLMGGHIEGPHVIHFGR